MYKTYDDVSIEYDYPFSFKNENRPYLIKKYKVNFRINGNIENTISIYATTSSPKVNIKIKSYRYDVVYKVDDVNVTSPISLTIPANTLGAGIYHIEAYNSTDGVKCYDKDMIVTQ